MNRAELEKRTKQFHINVIRLCGNLPKNAAGFEIAKQLIRSAGSVGSNYRVTKRAKSTNDFLNKLKIIIEEADESLYWMEVIRDVPLLQNEELNELIREADELTSIFVASHKTVAKNKEAAQSI